MQFSEVLAVHLIFATVYPSHQSFQTKFEKITVQEFEMVNADDIDVRPSKRGVAEVVTVAFRG